MVDSEVPTDGSGGGGVPVAEGLFTWPAADPRLIGSRCRACQSYDFPAQGTCPSCASSDVEQVELEPTGTIWTWTSQEFLPKAPPYAGSETAETFRRYFVGYVELPGQLRVEARLIGFDERPPRIGEAVRLQVVPFRIDADGNQVLIPSFAPTEGAQ